MLMSLEFSAVFSVMEIRYVRKMEIRQVIFNSISDILLVIPSG